MENEQTERWKATLMGETLLMGLLGKILYQDVEKSWLEGLMMEDVFSDAPVSETQPEMAQGLKILQGWAGQGSNGISDEEFEAVKKDQLYLFIGAASPKAPPWESAYFNEGRLLFQEQTLQVRQWYARYGLEAERKGREPDDHIGLELSFVAHLATLALQALESCDEGEAEKILQAQRDFLTQHLLRWAPAWVGLVKKHAGTDFYRGLAHLTLGALLAVADTLGIHVPEEALE
jgi:TorA maturation chaperone TorD